MKQNPQEAFNIREAKGEDYYKIMVVNESLKNFKGKNQYPWFLLINIDILEAVEPYGLPTDEEAVVLNKVEDELTSLISSTIDYQFIGRITDNGQRELYYYLKEPKGIHNALEKLIESGQYLREFEYSMSEDEEWENVEFFFDY